MVILLQCSDRVGLVADISKIMAESGLNILSMREYVDQAVNQFYIRLDIEGAPDADLIRRKLLETLPPDTEIQLNTDRRKNVIILVTREYHCLGDLLLRNYFDTLGARIQCVIGNHENLRPITEKFGVPFHFVPHENKSRAAFEQEVLDLIGKYETDYLVLAKFMRVLSPDFVSGFPTKIVNIHHSFLPAFAGARPYRQAHERGVKLIGATAHFVTNDLDEGPIIAQQIIPVNHAHTVNDMVVQGKEIEKAVLARALQLVFEDRVIVFRNKTIVFEN
jgi:formyltetrahydrofolate deformylase